MDLHIRTVSIEDAEYVTALSLQLGYNATKEQTKKRISGILKNTDHCVFVITVSEIVVGWIHGFYSLRIESDPFVEIGGLVVDKLYRKKGIGKLLVNKIIDWAKIRKNSKLKVRCNTIRTETHAFYRNLGFKEVKEQKIFEMELK